MNNELKGKVVSGYQAWFRAGDSLENGWIHWSRGSAPSQGKPSFEMYPDISEYPDKVMRPTGYPNFADGREARLFSSRTPEVMDLHFSWAAQYGIDCLALQRFYSEIVPERVAGHYDKDHLQWLKASAEKHGRLFYVMYDFSGAARHGDGIIEGCSQDWIINVEEGGLLDSPNYACYDGKKIVCLWGLTGLDQWRYPAAANALALINWYKERGYYVIGGFPDNDWATVADDYAAVYNAVDMISPWVVGRFRHNGGAAAWWQPVFARESAYCEKHGKQYMPVAFPGFAWCSFNGGEANMIPRNSGQFFWEQIHFLAKQGIENVYLAMFDEFDEGTAFMKAATDSHEIPTGESYFQTLSVDGLWLSSDYYLRLAGEVGQYLNKKADCPAQPTIAHSEGPVYWRNGFERRNYFHLDKKTTENATVDIGLYQDEKISGDISATIVETTHYGGKYALQLRGEGVYKIAPAKINCPKPLTLTYKTSGAVKAGVQLANGEIITAASGQTITTDQEITAIVAANPGGEGYIDDIHLAAL